MKVDLVRKFKWYIIGFILVAIMLSVSLSFCAWDTLSVKALLSAKGGNFAEVPPAPVWSDYLKGANGETLTSVPAVGSVVTYGRFYRESGATTTEPQRWIVVHNDESNKITLLSEKVVVYGNFWGNGAYLNNYYRSTVRSWLNSGRSSVGNSGANDNTRNDGVGSTFSGSGIQVNKGFLDVAFTGGAEKLLVPKKIEGMKYMSNPGNTITSCTTTTGNTSINDLVWLPSAVEVCGSEGGASIDGTTDTQFQYFTNNAANSYKISSATNYAWNAGVSSYYNNGGGSVNGSQTATWWWLRSPYPSGYNRALIVNMDGNVTNAGTSYSNGGVRPAVCVQL